MTEDIVTLAKINSAKLFSVRTDGLPQCPKCHGTACDRDLFSETETTFNDIMFCDDCGIYFELVTPKVKKT
jgi:hypothetical protein